MLYVDKHLEDHEKLAELAQIRKVEEDGYEPPTVVFTPKKLSQMKKRGAAVMILLAVPKHFASAPAQRHAIVIEVNRMVEHDTNAQLREAYSDSACASHIEDGDLWATHISAIAKVKLSESQRKKLGKRKFALKASSHPLDTAWIKNAKPRARVRN